MHLSTLTLSLFLKAFGQETDFSLIMATFVKTFLLITCKIFLYNCSSVTRMCVFIYASDSDISILPDVSKFWKSGDSGNK